MTQSGAFWNVVYAFFELLCSECHAQVSINSSCFPWEDTICLVLLLLSLTANGFQFKPKIPYSEYNLIKIFEFGFSSSAYHKKAKER